MIRIPFVLSKYISRHFFYHIMIVFALAMAIFVMFDFIETISRTHDKNIPLRIILEMVILRIPGRIQDVLPFVVLVGGILSLSKLSKTSEFVVSRAAGISVWQFMIPVVLTALAIGTIVVTVLNPLSATMLTRFEKLEAKYFRGSTSMLSLSSTGLWLRQQNEKGKKIIHALRLSNQGLELYDVTVYIFDENNSFSKRIDADHAALQGGYWYIKDAILTTPGQAARESADYKLETNLSEEEIKESFSPPRTISFWELPGFIATLKEAGFSAIRHVLYWQSMLAMPFVLAGMSMLAAAFSFHSPRQGKVGFMIVAGLVAGFGVRFFSNIINAMGLSGKIPVLLAAWSPMLIVLFIGIALIIHVEDA
jgi:lipopolysaccharide export system permease protein